MVNPQGQPPVGKAGTPRADKPRQPRSVWDSDPWGTERGDSGPLTRTVCGHEGGRPPGPLPTNPRPAQLHADTVSRLRPQVHQRHVLTGVHWGQGAQHSGPTPSRSLRSPFNPSLLRTLTPPFPPSIRLMTAWYHPLPLALAPLTHDGGPGHGAVLGPVVQANRGDGSVPREGDQRGDHELAALLGQKPWGGQRHWRDCQETQGEA